MRKVVPKVSMCVNIIIKEKEAIILRNREYESAWSEGTREGRKKQNRDIIYIF